MVDFSWQLPEDSGNPWEFVGQLIGRRMLCCHCPEDVCLSALSTYHQCQFAFSNAVLFGKSRVYIAYIIIYIDHIIYTDYHCIYMYMLYTLFFCVCNNIYIYI